MTRWTRSSRRVAIGGLLAATAAATLVGITGQPASAAPASAAPAIPTVAQLHGAMVSDDASAYSAALHSTDWVRTPNGLENRSCVTKLPAGATVVGHAIRQHSGRVTALPTCNYPRLVPPGSPTRITAARRATAASGPVPTTNGWMAASWWTSPTWLSRLYATFTVPPAPAVAGATNFFFPSFEPSDGSAIIQPVLSYGGSAAGGGNYWYITSWYVWGNQSVYGSNVSVNTGDLIAGTMTSSGCAGDGTNCTWTITTQDLTLGGQPASVLTTASGYSYSAAQGGVLESYGASSCTMLPGGGSIHFGDLQFADSNGNPVGPSFTNWVPDGECGANVSSSAATTDVTWSPN